MIYTHVLNREGRGVVSPLDTRSVNRTSSRACDTLASIKYIAALSRVNFLKMEITSAVIVGERCNDRTAGVAADHVIQAVYM